MLLVRVALKTILTAIRMYSVGKGCYPLPYRSDSVTWPGQTDSLLTVAIQKGHFISIVALYSYSTIFGVIVLLLIMLARLLPS